MPPALAIDGVFDIETFDWDRYVIGGLLSSSGEYLDTTNPDRLFDWLLKHGGQVWAHNGGRFDFLWFLDIAQRRGIRCQCASAGARLVTVQCGDLTLRDSAALIPLSLADAAAFGSVGQKGEWDHNTTRPDMPAAMLRELAGYLEQDCRVLLSALEGFLDVASDLGMTLRPTIGASAWATAAKTIGIEPAELTSAEYYGARAGYYGGRCQVLQTSARAGHHYDLASAYPWALATTPIPTGERYYLAGETAAMTYRAEREGVFEATVITPDMHVPVLPYRLSARVAYPVGKARGWWTGLELRAAEERGIEIEKVHASWVWEESEIVFGDFMAHYWRYRKEVGRKSPRGIAIKLFLNSLTGKLAQSPELETVHVCPEPDRIVCCPGGDCGGERGNCRTRYTHGARTKPPCCDHVCTGRCRRWSAIGRAVWIQPSWRIPGNARPEWAAHLTAATRIRLWDQLTADGRGGKTAVYCDTDSVFATRERSAVDSADLGEWEREGRFRDFVAVGPKAYRYNDSDGHAKQRAKGIGSLNRARWEQFAKGRAVPLRRGIQGIKTAARGDGGLFRVNVVSRANRAVAGWAGDRVINDDGVTTRPATLAEIRAAGRD